MSLSLTLRDREAVVSKGEARAQVFQKPICDCPALAGEGWGEDVSTTGQSLRGESPHPRLRRDLSRKRER
ncbi:hypothetical protein EGT07_32285 [Herbaspirillum sp. HC18]|nr:hypothetical protein EGT07_32285 [Herbaspirillum sp. HC18]